MYDCNYLNVNFIGFEVVLIWNKMGPEQALHG